MGSKHTRLTEVFAAAPAPSAPTAAQERPNVPPSRRGQAGCDGLSGRGCASPVARPGAGTGGVDPSAAHRCLQRPVPALRPAADRVRLGRRRAGNRPARVAGTPPESRGGPCSVARHSSGIVIVPPVAVVLDAAILELAAGHALPLGHVGVVDPLVIAGLACRIHDAHIAGHLSPRRPRSDRP